MSCFSSTRIHAVAFCSAMMLAATALGETHNVPGNEIVVAPGICPEAIDFLGKAIFLHSSGPCVECPADFDGDLDAVDLATVFGSWGPCA